MPINEILTHYNNVKPQGNGSYTALCPAHGDKTNSLSISEGNNDNIVIHCHQYGCTYPGFITAAGLKESDLYNNQHHQVATTRSKIEAIFDYKDENGNLLYQVVRWNPKAFGMRRPDGNGGWIDRLGDVRRVPYRLPQVIEAIKAGTTIFIPEGEAHVDRLVKEGLEGICNSGGAGKWRNAYSEFLQGANVVILPDNDESGRNHADRVAMSLHGIASRIRILELPNLEKEKDDIINWMDDGGTVKELERLSAEAPNWIPEATTILEESSIFINALQRVYSEFLLTPMEERLMLAHHGFSIGKEEFRASNREFAAKMYPRKRNKEFFQKDASDNFIKHYPGRSTVSDAKRKFKEIGEAVDIPIMPILEEGGKDRHAETLYGRSPCSEIAKETFLKAKSDPKFEGWSADDQREEIDIIAKEITHRKFPRLAHYQDTQDTEAMQDTTRSGAGGSTKEGFIEYLRALHASQKSAGQTDATIEEFLLQAIRNEFHGTAPASQPVPEPTRGKVIQLDQAPGKTYQRKDSAQTNRQPIANKHSVETGSLIHDYVKGRIVSEDSHGGNVYDLADRGARIPNSRSAGNLAVQAPAVTVPQPIHDLPQNEQEKLQELEAPSPATPPAQPLNKNISSFNMNLELLSPDQRMEFRRLACTIEFRGGKKQAVAEQEAWEMITQSRNGGVA